MKILIADDDEAVLDAYSTLLEPLGHPLTICHDGRQAWDAYRTGEFEVVILDWRMPEMDGLTVCRAIRRLSRAQYSHVLIVTASGREGYAECLDAGADDFIRKPFDPHELMARLRVAERMLRLHSHVSQLEGILSVCSYCKAIRNDQQQWLPMEGYISKRTKVEFSHGICPPCVEKQMSLLKARGNPLGE